MRKVHLLATAAIVALVIGCGGGEEAKTTEGTVKVDTGKQGVQRQGMPAESVGVTDAGKNAEAETGSRLGN